MDTENKEKPLYTCDICDFTTYYKGNYKHHLSSIKHKNNLNPTDTCNEYNCDCCNYMTTNKKDYTRHMSSKKHEINALISRNKLQPNQCGNCNKILCSQKNLWRHKKTCRLSGENESQYSMDENTDQERQERQEHQERKERQEREDTADLPDPRVNPTFVFTPELFMQMYKQNTDFQMLMLEQQKYMIEKMGSNNNNNINTNANNNNNNKTFNIQFFLNEHCKNAIDIHEFVRTLDYSTENLEKTMQLGYVGGISKMMTDKIRVTPIEERPLHCCDEKREKLYIKNNGEWVTGNESKEVLYSIIADIANNNYKTFQKWVCENPSCMVLDTPAYEKYMIIYQGVIGSRSDEEEIKHVKKILTNIMEDIVIEKDKYSIEA